MDDLPIFVDEPAEYEPQGDHIVARWKGREYHMPIAVAKKAVRRLNRAIDQWHEGRADVIRMRH